MQKIDLLGCTKEEIKDFVTVKLKEKEYRTKQIVHWIYKKRVTDIINFTDLPAGLRDKLNHLVQIGSLQLISKEISQLDGTTRYNFKTQDNYIVSCVYIPKLERKVVCISTQIGCSVGCVFCHSGKMYFVRNLTTGEIVEQVYAVRKDVGEINGILYMGMGEPLLNYDNVVKSIKIFLDTDMFAMSKRRITVSTVGVVPNIYRLADEKLGVKLAISLHSYNDEQRKWLVKRLKFKLNEILEAGVYYAEVTKTKFTIEYVLIGEINDSEEHAKFLVKLLDKLPKIRKFVKINLIPYNTIPEENFIQSQLDTIEKFKQILVTNGYLTFIRKPYGNDINAACGQLGF
ncbi:MAG: 23S rRNA (adenine(2503)-C(2))-methyltransferase RlmN [Endomicrobia bacterium]|nr:23S rRNA (adenine(2503)-C(2))-methyltransferase RlmN [Endomicrobiia bacterium]